MSHLNVFFLKAKIEDCEEKIRFYAASQHPKRSAFCEQYLELKKSYEEELMRAETGVTSRRVSKIDRGTKIYSKEEA
jgi:hypothetical protein